jgi:hypothetical protein
MADSTDGAGGGGDTPDGEGAAGEFLVVDDTDEAVAGGTEGDAGAAAQGTAEAAPPPLNAARVRQLSALRRGAYRARSYCVVAIGLCLVGAGQLAAMTVRHVRAAGWEWRPAGYVCGIIAAMMAAAFFARRAAELNRELRTPRRSAAAGDAQAAPDFSTLSDGSHAWKNLEQMRGGS